MENSTGILPIKKENDNFFPHESKMKVVFTLKSTPVPGFTDMFAIEHFPADIGRKEFEVDSSTSSYVELRQISRTFFTIQNDMKISISPRNNTHFQFLNEKGEIINSLNEPLQKDFTLKVASYDIDTSSTFRCRTFQQQTPAVYDIQVIDPLFDEDEQPEKKKSRRKEVADLICPYCDKKFKTLSLHIRHCKNRPSDRKRPTPDENGFISKKRLWERR